MSPLSPTSRFSARAEAYAKHRPSYPQELFQFLIHRLQLSPEHHLADIGSGTGIFAGMLLEQGYTVYAVEPNDAMREQAELRLKHYPRFHSIAGTAESIPLPDASIDMITSAQAFHWFDPVRTRTEWMRIIKPEKYVVLIWNNRDTAGSSFATQLEQFIQEFAIDYDQVFHNKPEKYDAIDRFFEAKPYDIMQFEQAQIKNFSELKGWVLSLSYMPFHDHPMYGEMEKALEQLFVTHAQQDQVQLHYHTEVIYGKLR